MLLKLFTILAVSHLCISSEVLWQEDLALTIYNNGEAMVKDTRRISFDRGQSQVDFTDVATTIKPETVMFTPSNQTGKITIFEQNFQNNLASKYTILKNYLDKNVIVDVAQGNNVRTVIGKLLSYNDGFILQNPNGVSIYNEASGVRVPSLPGGLLVYPTLVWIVYSLVPVTTSCEVAYRASNINWKADYLMKLNDDQDKADFSGWVTIDNNSGKKYNNTRIKLIAGDINTVVQPRPYYAIGVAGSAQARGGSGLYGYRPPEFTQKTFSDYHMYSLSRPVNLNESSKKQIEFIPKAYNVSVTKTYNYDVPVGGNQNDNIKFESTYKFLNSKANKLGIPLPAGTIRVFKTDNADNSLQFIGQNTIKHTPRDENVSIKTGTAFDLVGKMNSINKTTYDRGGYDAKIQFNITNRGDKPAPVILNLNNYNGDNNRITHDPGYVGPRWRRINSNKYELTTTVPVNRTQVILWNENYRP